ncbi:MAG: energy-coupling factor ABC transporter permease [Actinomycetota bacterium]|nr:energy-coupling factor ABC transporter permease [Actinomycetota bacterium]
MHVPEHLISDPTEIITAVGATAVLAAAAFRPARPATGDPRRPPTLVEHPERVGPQVATAALVFALQMVNVPVLPGTSGHLFGGALATALLGPRRALFAVTAVLASQALFFADGGVGALGVNVLLISIIPVLVTATAMRLVATSGRIDGRWWASVALGSLAGPAVAALAFAGIHAVGGTTQVPIGEMTSAMLGVHTAVGVGELVVTLAALGAIVALRQLSLSPTAALGLGAVGTAGVLSLAASSQLDGLERVAGDLGFAVSGPGSILHGSPLADYAVSGLSGSLSSSTAGLIGLVLTAVVAGGLALLIRPTSTPATVSNAA